MRILVVFYSMYGHILKMAEAEAAGAGSVDGAEVAIRRVPETLSQEVLDRLGARETQEATKKYEECTLEDLAAADGIIFGTPTRFGNMTGQMRQFMDKTGRLWAEKALAGKVGAVFTSSATQHGGQESTILSFHTTLLHHGMVIAGLPYLFEGQSRFDEITGCSPYGASAIVGPDNSHLPTENELEGARWQGQYVALLTRALAPAREELIHDLKSKEKRPRR